MTDNRLPDLGQQTKKPTPLGHLPLRQRALAETILAYYDRGHAVQYDAQVMTIQDKYATEKGAILRQTDYTSPEMATEDDFMYIVCSAFPWEAVYNTFGYKMRGSPLAFKSFRMIHAPEDDPLLVFHYYEEEGKPDEEGRRKAAEEINALLQPCDLLIAGDEKGAHTMIFMGDFLGDGKRYLMHCAGKKYNMETGEDSVEHGRINDSGGALRIDPVETFLFPPEDATAVFAVGHMPRMVVLRPLACMDEAEYPLSPSAVTRLRFPRLTVDRRLSHNRCMDVEEGGKVTVTVTLRNCGNRNYTAPLTITEKLPDGCVLMPESITGGGTVEGNTLKWQKQLQYGEKVSVSYAVEVTAKRGETLLFGGGSVDTIPSNTVEVKVGGKHVAARPFALLQGGGKLGEGNFAEALYRQVLGLDVPIPCLADLEKALFTEKSVVGAEKPMLHPLKDLEKLAPMLIPVWFGGMEVQTESSRDRILTVLTRQMRPGDVILSQKGEKDLGVPDCAVYLGNDRIACAGDDGTVRILDAAVLEKIFPSRLFVGLRPSLAYDDISEQCKLPAESR